VAVNGVRAEHQVRRDLAITETARHTREDFALTDRKNLLDLLLLAPVARCLLHRSQRFAACANNGIGVTVPWKVRASFQRDECCAGNRGRDLAPEPVRHGTVVTPMHHQRWRADERKVVANIEAIDESQYCGRGFGRRRLTLQPTEAFVLVSVGSAEKDIAEKA
jgi:hypothetical protein